MKVNFKISENQINNNQFIFELIDLIHKKIIFRITLNTDD